MLKKLMKKVIFPRVTKRVGSPLLPLYAYAFLLLSYGSFWAFDLIYLKFFDEILWIPELLH